MTHALVVIDVQNEYIDGGLPIAHPPVEQSLERITAVMDIAAANDVAIVLVRHTESDAEGGVFVRDSAGWQLHDSVSSRPHDYLIDKELPGSFTGTDLQDWLLAREIDTIVIAGYMTHMCVDTTARQAAHLGLTAIVLSDATGTIDLGEDLPAEVVHQVELAVLGDGLATVMTSAQWVDSLA